ncbi:alpha/beta hydrolase fold-1 domain-containing protein [Cavenderia fasciculata]|uniref:Alpha/beta hydrolase fold-1 domain-containing protein n=1 Tax=Cavenderia fasciculata TaxID=261658 RepID=F4Q5B2_CACFS|nr:alpha/beta hydrolase fold-1 domain-containing protein [Cavenderia fasciculata]EGG17171.1 alpha/beta hydrolase fold-1 domain-containing protein [Cavenderia fasciculata]|eukprot:XP_004355655.1 alpha/beta hydrolase fold-1 domain-containing protein [Cavenderia fasciculata]
MKSPIELYFDNSNIRNIEILEQCPTMYKQDERENIEKDVKFEESHGASSIDSPSITNHATFETSFILTNSHIMNYYAAYQRVDLDLPTKRETFIMSDGGTISVNWFELGEYNDDTPTILILHGLTGGYHERYVQHFAQYAHQKSGYRSLVFNYRGCAGNEVTADKIYCANFLDDLKWVVEWLKQRLPNTKLFLLGFSLGASILVNYLSSAGDTSPFVAHCSISNPLDMKKCGDNLKSTMINQQFYNQSLANNLIDLFQRWGNRLDSFATLEQLKKARSIKDVDDMVTSKVHGYKDADDYYEHASSCNHIEFIKKPTLFINARDDPISPGSAIPFSKIKNNPNTILACTKYGGHLGFMYNLHKNQPSWSDQITVEYFNTFLK